MIPFIIDLTIIGIFSLLVAYYRAKGGEEIEISLLFGASYGFIIFGIFVLAEVVQYLLYQFVFK